MTYCFCAQVKLVTANVLDQRKIFGITKVEQGTYYVALDMTIFLVLQRQDLNANIKP